MIFFPNYTNPRTQTGGCYASTDLKSDGQCSVPLGHGFNLVAYRTPNGTFLDVSKTGPRERSLAWWVNPGGPMGIPATVTPFVCVEVLSKAATKSFPHPTGFSWGATTIRPATYNDGMVYPNGTGKSGVYVYGPLYHFIRVRVTGEDGTSAEGDLRLTWPDAGKFSLKDAKGSVITVHAELFGTSISRELDISTYREFHKVLGNVECVEGLDALWSWWLAIQEIRIERTRKSDTHVDLATKRFDGVKAVASRKDIKPNLARLQADEPVLWAFLQWLYSGQVSERTTNNKLICTMLLSVGTDYNKLVAELRRVIANVPHTDPLSEPSSYNPTPVTREICLSLTGATEKIEAEKAKLQWQFAKGARAQARVLGISEERHPVLLALITSGDVPLGLFHESGNEDKLINVEFDLIERALTREGWQGPLVEIFQSATARTTYSRRVTSYLAFLFRIERYLNRHAPGTPWKAYPKFVSAQWELEMEEKTETGTTKRRSAMTPVADNAARTVTVPYVAMSVAGISTTYCYSEVYFIAEEGAEDPIFDAGGVYPADLVEKLNGRDDYGLCCFTLTGTSRNQGYPTFLVIFERTSLHGTQVHFHRVHPSRKRGPNGTDTPPCRLIEECYRYMAGNIRAEDISYQQGDLLLTPAEGAGKSEDPMPVYGFENHSFTSNDPAQPVLLYPSAMKDANLLGWLHAPAGMSMPHPEHEPVLGISPGWYALRRCRSWEASPSGVWVLNID